MIKDSFWGDNPSLSGIQSKLKERMKGSVFKEHGIIKDVLENMKVDKKSRDGILYLILLNDIGKATVTAKYTQRALTKTINHFLE